MKQVAMRPQDVVILLKKISPAGYKMSGKELSLSLGISQSEVSESLVRSQVAGLLDPDKCRVNTLAFSEFLIYGLRYCFPVVFGGNVRGVPTAVSATPIKERVSKNMDVFVWPSSKGQSRGQSITPLYPSVPDSTILDKDFYALMVIADTLRCGKAREREIAIEVLNKYILDYAREHREA